MGNDNLLNNIWKTKKSRINTAERYKRNAEFIANINVYYSLIITAISLYLIRYPEDNISLIVVMLSVCLTVSIVFFGTKKYEERARDLQINYIELNELYNRASKEGLEIQEINEKYNKILQACENHSEYDYFKVIWGLKDETLTLEQSTKYIVKTIQIYMAKIAIILFPLIILAPFYKTIIGNIFKV